MWLTLKISRLYEELTALDIKPVKFRGSRNNMTFFFVQFPEERSLLEGVEEWEGESLPPHQGNVLSYHSSAPS